MAQQRTWLPTLALLGTTASWGSTFFMVKIVLGELPVADFLAVRFILAALALLVLFARPVARLPREQLRNAAVLGAVYGAAQLLQTAGLATTPASVSGFVTGMYVVLTPVLGLLLFRHHPPISTWWAVALATVGLGFLSLQGLAISPGISLTLLSAVLYALHIVWLGRWSAPEHSLGLAAVQMAVIAAVCSLAAIPDGVALPQSQVAWAVVIYMALIAGALALVAQTWAQSQMPATRAAIVMTLEPVFASGFAVAFGGDQLTARLLIGGGLVLAAMFLVELADRLPMRRGRPDAAVPGYPSVWDG